MPSGMVRKRNLDGKMAYEAVVELGVDPVTGKRKRTTKTFRTKKEAQAWLTSTQTDVDKGTFVEQSRQTVAELLRYWMETYAKHHVRATTYEGYGYTVNVHLIPGLGSIPVQKLTPGHLQQFYADKLSGGAGPRVVQLCHLRIKQALAMAVNLGVVPRNVADAVAAPKTPHSELAVWTPDEAQHFSEVARSSHYGPIWLVLAATGMRRGEALGLRWQDVDWVNDVLHVRQQVVMVHGSPQIQQPKTRASHRAVPVDRWLIDELREHKVRQNERRLLLGEAWQERGLVFPTAVGTPVSGRNLDREYKKLLRQAGVPPIRIHDIRRTVATVAIASGLSPKAVSEHLGHSKTSITLDIYTKVMAEQRVEVAKGIGAAMIKRDASAPAEARTGDNRKEVAKEDKRGRG